MRCFVIMPFGNPREDRERARKLDLIYSQWIKPTVESISIPNRPNEKIECHRADKESSPGEIISHIVENLVVSDIVIADLSGRNPNVFYELGVRHAVNNNTILIAEDLMDIPFDLRGLRTIAYQYDPEQMMYLKKSLEDAIRRILCEPGKIDNPARRYLYEREIGKLANQSVPPGYDAVKSIVDEMSALRTEFREYASQVRQVMNLVTSAERDNGSPETTQAITLGFFEGIWHSPRGGTYCARVVDGNLYIPYCYDGNTELTAHYFNCRVIGNTLFARFKWFLSPISGFVYYKIESTDRIAGGWRDNDVITPDLEQDISRANAPIPGIYEAVLERDLDKPKFPAWAARYFRAKMYLP